MPDDPSGPQQRMYGTVPLRCLLYQGPFVPRAERASNRTTGDLAMTKADDFSARTVGFTGGFDYRLTPNTAVGLAFAAGAPIMSAMSAARLRSFRPQARPAEIPGSSRGNSEVR